MFLLHADLNRSPAVLVGHARCFACFAAARGQTAGSQDDYTYYLPANRKITCIDGFAVQTLTYQRLPLP
jgi:hypothetical protein